MTSVEIEQGLSTAQIARAVDVPIDTVRYYERVGLLPEPPRTTGAHRRYPPTMVDRLQFIRGAQRLGLRLAEIRDLLAVRDTGVCPCEPAELLLRRHLDEIDSEMRRLPSCARTWSACSRTCPALPARTRRRAPGAHPSFPDG